MEHTLAICDEQSMLDAVEHYGILQFWSEEKFSAWALSAVNFNTFWSIRESLVNSDKIAYGKFVGKKATFISLKVFPYFCAMRRNGYDFDSLCDEGLVSNREQLIMSAVGSEQTPSYALSKSLGIKGFDAASTALQDKTYLCLWFKKSMMGTALLCRPEDVFGEQLVRSKYLLSPSECAQAIRELAAPGLKVFGEKEREKLLSPSV